MENETINPLEYKPSFQRSERERTAWELNQVDLPPGNFSDDEKEIGTGLIGDIIEYVDTIEKELLNKIEELEESFKGITFELNETISLDVEKAKELLELPKGDLTFNDYKEALKQWESPAGDYLLEIIESQIEGVNGNIELELYQDYIELEREYAIIQEYLARMLAPVLNMEWDKEKDDFKDLLTQMESDWGANKTQATESYQQAKKNYAKAFVSLASNITSEKSDKYLAESDYRNYSYQNKRIEEALATAQSKAREVERFLYLGEKLIKDDAIDSDKTELLTFVDHYSEEKDKDSLLTQSALMLTLSVENYNNEKHHYKHSLRNIYSPTKQERVLDELSVYHDLYQTDLVPLSYALKSYQENVDSKLSHFLTGVTSGLLAVSTEKDKRTAQLQKSVLASSNLRLKKLEQVTEKENIRQSYQLIQEIKEEMNTTL